MKAAEERKQEEQLMQKMTAIVAAMNTYAEIPRMNACACVRNLNVYT